MKLPADIALAIVELAIAGELPTTIATRTGCDTDDVAGVLRTHGGSPAKLRAAAEMLRAKADEPADDAIADMLSRARKTQDPRLVKLVARAEREIAAVHDALTLYDRDAERRKRITELEAELDRLRGRGRHQCPNCRHVAPTERGLLMHRTRSHRAAS